MADDELPKPLATWEAVVSLVSLLSQVVVKFMRDHEVRSLTVDLRQAKSKEEKLDVSRRIADALYRGL